MNPATTTDKSLSSGLFVVAGSVEMPTLRGVGVDKKGIARPVGRGYD